jgi:hypothetical protein
MRRCIELFSKLKINQLYLVIDTDEGENADFNSVIAAKMYALDEVCRRHYVELIPTFIISHHNQRISIDLLRNFSHKSLALLLHLESPDNDNDNDATDFSESSCYDTCKAAISTIALAGIKSIILSTSSYVDKMASPEIIAHRFDLTVFKCDIDELLNPSLFTRPLLCFQTTIGLMSKSSLTAKQKSQSSYILPVILDSDFMFPLLFAKFSSYLHGGFGWNRVGVCDMLEDFSDCKILRETLSQFLFETPSEDLNELLSSSLDLLTLQKYSDDSVPTDQINPNNNPKDRFNVEMFMVEKILWTLIKSNYKDINLSPMPSKEIFTEYLKVIRRAQSLFKYKINDLPKFIKTDRESGEDKSISNDHRKSIEVFEILSILHLLSSLCRAIILAYNVKEKSPDYKNSPPCSFVALMKFLNPGTKSDSVNTLLEATDYCANIWRQRYDVLYFNTEETIEKSKLSNPQEIKIGTYKQFQKSLVKKYLFTKDPELPVLSIMHVVGEKLPFSISTIMAKFFSDKS